MGQQKWYYFSIMLALIFFFQTGWNFYQNSLQTEKKIHRFQKLVKKRREEQKKRLEDDKAGMKVSN